MEYLEFLMSQGIVTRTRRAFDAALRALAVTQHHRIWPLYLKFVRMHDIPETAVRVYRRYLQVDPNGAEECVEYLESIGRVDDAAVQLTAIVNNEGFKGKTGKTNHQLWQDLCRLICAHPASIHSLNVEDVVRGVWGMLYELGALPHPQGTHTHT